MAQLGCQGPIGFGLLLDLSFLFCTNSRPRYVISFEVGTLPLKKGLFL